MVLVDLRSLISKLNDPTKQTLEAAAGLCLSRTNYDVEIEHWLMKLLEQTDSDVAAINQFFGVDAGRLTADLTRSIESFKTGNSRPPSLSPRIVDLAREAWVYGSCNFNAPLTRSGHIVAALLSDDSLSRMVNGISSEFEKISPEELKKNFENITGDSFEAKAQNIAQSAGRAGAPTAPTGTTALDQYTINLTEQAKEGNIDPVLGRDAEIRQIVDILTRRRQNNPILTGEAGVGKTAVVEGFALRIAKGDVPPSLQDVDVRTLDLGLLQAGASVKGEFENRLRSVIDEVKGSTTPIILFIDEAHTLIGAGGQAGQNDAANLLKPALARGELRTIAATTWLEYKKYFEKDPALTRRFQVVKIDEPTEAVAIEMMRGLSGMLQKHHGVRILDEAVVEAVKLSHRYIPDRQMPDKCVSVLDTACARVGISQAATPAAVEDAQRRLEQIEVALGILQKEQDAGAVHGEDIDSLETEKTEVSAQIETLTQQWQSEKALANQINELLAQLNDESVEDKEAIKTQLLELEDQLKSLQGESPMLHTRVDAQAVAEVIGSWTGIPVGRMMSDEIQSVLNLSDQLEERVIGQRHALEAIAKSIRTSRAKLTDPNKPIGVFMMVGTSGVGKTETALALADLLYGGEQNLTTINMSEFKEEHKVSLLMGSPPGYVGYGEGGVLTEAVRRKPYSIVLLDEVEKAHPGIQDIFYQVFDKGNMKDGEGRDIDFKNTIIIMTSNLGTDTITKLCADPETMPEPDGLLEAVKPDLLSYFKPAFLGRTTQVAYYPLHDEALRKIIALKLNRIGKRIGQNYKASFEYTDDVLETIASRCQEVDSGARLIDNLLNDGLLPRMSSEFLSRLASGEAVSGVKISVGDSGELDISVS